MTAGNTTTAVPAPPRWRQTRRWLCVVLVALTGVLDLVATTHVRPHAFFRPPPRAMIESAVGAAVGGPHFLLLAAGVTGVLLSLPLARGKRTAWLTALAVSLGSTAVLWWHHEDPRLRAVTGVTVIALAVNDSVFRARTDPHRARYGLYVLVGGWLTVFGYAVVGLFLLPPDEAGSRSPLAVAGEALRLIFLLSTDGEVMGRREHVLVDSVRWAALAVTVVGLARLVATVLSSPARGSERERARALLEAHATTALAHFELLDDKSWFFAADGRAFVGYRVSGTTAVALGGPVGAPDALAPALAEFLAFCDSNGWTPALHQLTEPERDVALGAGMKVLKIGEEAIVDVTAWTLEGREHKSMRSAVRKCERAGYRLTDLSHPLTDDDLRRLRDVSDAWLADGGHRERTFTLGRFDADYLRSTQVVAVVDAEGELQAFANLLPPYAATAGTFDLMRRRPGSLNGVMDFLLNGLVERFRADGLTGLNLGMAPLANSGAPEPGLPGRAIRLIYDRLDGLFNFQGLRAYKDKFHPRWESRYLAYPSEAVLLKVAGAVARIGELPDPRSPRERVARVLRRFPVSSAFWALQLWLMAVTAVSPRAHVALLAAFGSSGPTLGDGQIWRLVTSPLMQTHAGFVWVNLGLALAVPLAEWRLGSETVPVVYLLGDVISTSVVLGGLEVAAHLGSATARVDAATLDAGTSSGSLALLAAVAWSCGGRVRIALLGGLFGVLAGYVAVGHHLYDAQHLLAAAAGLGVAVAITRPRRRGAHPAAPD